jgi:hypothetical protein
MNKRQISQSCEKSALAMPLRRPSRPLAPYVHLVTTEDWSMHLIGIIFCGVMLLAPSFQEPSLYQWNKKSTLNVDHQVEFPGIVLEPGVYVVNLRESGDKRSLVQILNRDETQVLASVLALANYRVRPDRNTEFTFHNTKRASPEPVQSWFLSGDLGGLEFVYPKPRAKEIAKESGDQVLAANTMNKDDVIVAMMPNGKEIILENSTSRAARHQRQ